MLLCPFCAFINGLCSTRPDLNVYNATHDPKFWDDLFPRGNQLLEKGGAYLTEDWILTPTNYSDQYDKIFQVVKPEIKRKLEFFVNKRICDSCLMQMYLSGDINVISELEPNEKLFRLYMKKQ